MLRHYLSRLCSGSSTPLLRLDTFSWIVTRDSHKNIPQFPTFVAANHADVRSPPVGRGPQVENHCSRPICPMASPRNEVSGAQHDFFLFSTARDFFLVPRLL